VSTEAHVRTRLLRAGARLPYRASGLASGFDLYACLGAEEVLLGPLPSTIPTGLALEVPPGFDAQIRPRSGLARLGVLSTFGTLDSDYRGELLVTMYTLSPDIRHTIRDGDRIAQLVISMLADVRFEEVEELSPTERGSGGHGSTGR